MAEWSKAPDSRIIPSPTMLVRAFWSTNVGVGSNPTSDTLFDLLVFAIRTVKITASAGNQTPINCLEGNYANHYTTDA